MKRLSFIAAVLLCFVTVAGAAIRPAQPGIGGGGSTVSGSITGAYSFAAGFTTSNATDVFLTPAISNLMANTAITNKWNAWQFWCDPVSTNTYHAENRGLGIKTNSTDFSALLQSVLNRGTEGFSYKFEPNPFYTNAYVISNTVIVTNWGTWSGDLAGNPTVAFRASTNFTGPLFQLGAYGMQLGGISGWRDIRFEGDQGSTNCTGVELRNVVEPIFAFCEFTGFKATGIRVATTNAIYWTYVDNCWFVQKWTSSKGITFAATPQENQNQCHFRISGSTFGGNLGDGIIVSNWFPNIQISDNKFFGTAMNDGIGIYAGSRFSIANNEFQNLLGQGVYFYDQLSATNFNSSVTDNMGNVVLGDYVQGVLLSGNNAGYGVDSVLLVGNNGPNIVNFDSAELRLGFLTITNRVLYADSSGLVKPVSSSSPSTEYVKADGTVAVPTNFITTAHGSAYVTNSVTAQSFIGSGTGAAQLQLFSTNGNAAVLGISSDTISVTNVLGVSRRGTNNLMFDMNFVGKFTITNKFDFAASITFSNCAEGQEYAGILSGGGTSRVITFRADTNCLFADLDAFGVARATTKAVTLTNGNDMEISAYVTRPLYSAFGTTNVINIITRQYAQ